MKTIIIEDEYITAEELSYYLRKIDPGLEIIATLESVEESVTFLEKNGCPDLIFSDIQLADGLSFEIYEQVTISCPIIFCTAFEEYAIQAFNTNGIDYILKPFDEKAVQKSLEKYRNLTKIFGSSTNESLDTKIKRLLSEVKYLGKRTSMLVNHKGKYFPIAVEDIAYFFTENEIVWLYRKNGEKYVVDHTLDELEKMFESKDFYRANRQYILSRYAILEFEPYFNRKLAVKLTQHTPELITISKIKTTDFIRWVEMG